MAFAIDKKAEGTNLVLAVKGNVDEDANFAPQDLGAATGVVLDLEGVTGINSVGIREWIKWVKTMPSSVKLSVRKVPKIVVDQINMVSGFLPPGTTVESFFVPYYSDASGSEKMVLFENGKEYSGSELKAPAEIKDDSGEVMEMDVIEAKYFKFLKNG
jgi:anti-anti-sigma regulatory factor